MRRVRQVAPGDIWCVVHKVIKLAEWDAGNGATATLCGAGLRL
jgi:hypothetical protein